MAEIEVPEASDEHVQRVGIALRMDAYLAARTLLLSVPALQVHPSNILELAEWLIGDGTYGA